MTKFSKQFLIMNLITKIIRYSPIKIHHKLNKNKDDMTNPRSNKVRQGGFVK